MVKEDNAKVLNILGTYLNNYPQIIKEKDILDVCKAGVSKYQAYLLLLQSFFNIDTILFNDYFPNIVKEENVEDYYVDPYFKNVRPKEAKLDEWEIKYSKIKKYEGFVRDDFKEDFTGKIYPQLGFFTTDFEYLSIYQDGRLWMSITPNEINTMKKPINRCHGHVTTLGLGLGYFAYMASLKDEVTKVTVVEIDYKAIKLFQSTILPFFPKKEKIEIIHMDALDYINMDFESDYVFADLWHDVSDGLKLYKEISRLASFHPDKEFDYWIYDTMKYYLK